MLASPQPTGRQRPFFSIITISLNAEKSIGPTLQSVAGQKGVEGLVEHWVVDGASQDGTLEIVRQFPHVHTISEKDKGISDAFNKGMNLASGEYILYLNCDDLLYDERVLADLYRFAVSRRLPAWIVGHWYARQTDGSIRLVKPRIPLAGWSLFLGPRICHQAVVLKLEAQRQIGGFDLDYKVAMDYDSWAKLYQAGYTITRFARPLIVYAGEGLSTRHPDWARRDHTCVKQRLRDSAVKRLVGACYDQLEVIRERVSKRV